MMDIQVAAEPLVEVHMKPTALRRFGKFIVILIATFIAEVAGVLTAQIAGMQAPNLDMDMLSELALAAAFVGLMYIFGAQSLLRFDKESFVRQFKYMRGYIYVALILFGFEFLSVIPDLLNGTINLLDPQIIGRTLVLVLTCAGIGIFEETYFRGLMHHGFLAWLGTSSKGVRVAFLLSALFFGAMHISFQEIVWDDPLQVMQVILKIVQVGIMGLSLSVITTRERNLWGAIFYHGLHDFILLFNSYVLYDVSAQPSYVDTSALTAWSTITTYCIIILMYTPMAVRALQDVFALSEPDEGVTFAKGIRRDVALSVANSLNSEDKLNRKLPIHFVRTKVYAQAGSDIVVPANFTQTGEATQQLAGNLGVTDTTPVESISARHAVLREGNLPTVPQEFVGQSPQVPPQVPVSDVPKRRPVPPEELQ